MPYPSAQFVSQFSCERKNQRSRLSEHWPSFKTQTWRHFLQSHQLPPTKEALENHLKRANYQSFIWKHALQTEVNQSPDGQGWQQKNGQLEIYWTNQALAPQAVMELICCRCKGSCQTRRCSCVSNGLPCTEACTCQDNCLNCISKDDSEDDDSDDDTDGDEYES